MHALEARELYRFFHSGDEEVKALRGVDVTLDDGEMIALVGPSGSGKSTLLLCLAGLDEPDGGEVLVAGERMTRRDEASKTRLRSRSMGIMLQTNNLFAHLTVAQNIGLTQEIAGPADAAWASEVLQRIGIAARATALPAQLSGGERARAALAVALARKPKILILDEPTGEVDTAAEAAILQVLEEHRRAGGSVVVATHNAAAARSADRVLPMRDGRLADG
jgi:putative ABC transport system ATP-binding protein